MSRWRRGAALVVAYLLTAATAFAQPYLYSPIGAARIPDPIPTAPPTQALVPGPLTPAQAPPGPPPELSLPWDHSSAFPCEEYPPVCEVYFHLGAQGLTRQRFGHFPLAVLDPGNIDVGPGDQEDLPLLLDISQLSERMNFGARGTLGVMYGGMAFEATGYYIFENTSSYGIANPGRIDGFFFNPPLGFEGNNGLWTQADRMIVERQSTLGSLELNARGWNTGIAAIDLIVGVRYIDLFERINVATDDDGISFPDAEGNPDPTRAAVYRTEARNRIVAPQLGFECTFVEWLCFGLGVTAKGAWGANFVDVNTHLKRGDGLIGFKGGRDDIQFSHIYDVGFHLDIHLLERMRVRAGYNAMWLLNVSNVQDVIEYNLEATNGRFNEHGSIFYHGPSLEMQFLF